jgi:O-methyltransferase
VIRGLLGEFAPDVEHVPLDRPRLAPAKRLVFDALAARGYLLTTAERRNVAAADAGTVWPRHAFTMIGRERLANVRTCTEDVIGHGVAGDFIEAGVWKGGATILMRAVLEAWSEPDRDVWVADSFRGLPPPDGRFAADEGAAFHTYDDLAIPLEQVRANFDRFGLLDERVHFLAGWFRDTLPALADRRWSVIRLDGDMYQSIWDGLDALYPNLSPGGWVIVDDYGWIENCRRAVDDFRRERGISEVIERVDDSAVCWRKALDS